MQIDALLAEVRTQFEAVAALGDDRAREIAAAVATAAGPAVRLAIMNALAMAAEDATTTLLDFPGSPALRIGLEEDRIRVDVQATTPVEAPPAARPDDGDASARISLRLSEALKNDIERAAAAEGVSVNAWLVRAATQGLQPQSPWHGWAEPGTRSGPHHVTGWING